jgi:hypothetical protein
MQGPHAGAARGDPCFGPPRPRLQARPLPAAANRHACRLPLWCGDAAAAAAAAAAARQGARVEQRQQRRAGRRPVRRGNPPHLLGRPSSADPMRLRCLGGDSGLPEPRALRGETVAGARSPAGPSRRLVDGCSHIKLTWGVQDLAACTHESCSRPQIVPALTDAWASGSCLLRPYPRCYVSIGTPCRRPVGITRFTLAELSLAGLSVIGGAAPNKGECI